MISLGDKYTNKNNESYTVVDILNNNNGIVVSFDGQSQVICTSKMIENGTVFNIKPRVEKKQRRTNENDVTKMRQRPIQVEKPADTMGYFKSITDNELDEMFVYNEDDDSLIGVGGNLTIKSDDYTTKSDETLVDLWTEVLDIWDLPVVRQAAKYTWKLMKSRCERQKGMKASSLCTEWQDFEGHYTWYRDNYYGLEQEKTVIDKDLRGNGKRIYSPETCCFLPKSLNDLIGDSRFYVDVTSVENAEGRHRYSVVKVYRSRWEKSLTSKMYKQYRSIDEIKQEIKEAYLKVLMLKLSRYSGSIPWEQYEKLGDYIREHEPTFYIQRV